MTVASQDDLDATARVQSDDTRFALRHLPA